MKEKVKGKDIRNLLEKKKRKKQKKEKKRKPKEHILVKMERSRK